MVTTLEDLSIQMKALHDKPLDVDLNKHTYEVHFCNHQGNVNTNTAKLLTVIGVKMGILVVTLKKWI